MAKRKRREKDTIHGDGDICILTSILVDGMESFQALECVDYGIAKETINYRAA